MSLAILLENALRTQVPQHLSVAAHDLAQLLVSVVQQARTPQDVDARIANNLAFLPLFEELIDKQIDVEGVLFKFTQDNGDRRVLIETKMVPQNFIDINAQDSKGFVNNPSGPVYQTFNATLHLPPAIHISTSTGFISDTQLTQIKQITARTTWLLKTLLDIYRTCIPFSWELISLNNDPAHAIMVMLDNLRQANAGKSFPLLLFVERLARTQCAQAIHDELKQWVNQTAQMIGLDMEGLRQIRDQAASIPTLPPPSNPYLFFECSPTRRKNTFNIRAWLQTDDYRRFLVEAEKQDRKALQKILDQTLHTIIETGEVSDVLEQLTIAFFLPRNALCADINTLAVRVGWNLEQVGKHYRVVVRSWERVRYTASIAPEWKRKWDKLTQHPPSVLWLSNLTEYNDHQLWVPIHELLCLALALVPPSVGRDWKQDTLMQAIGSGVPVALWVRELTHSPDQIREILDPFLTDQFMNLPEIIRRQRSAPQQHMAGFWQQVILLWDDPYRRPPVLPLRYPYEAS